MNFWMRPNTQAVRTDDTDDPGQGTGLVADIPVETRQTVQSLDLGDTYDPFPGIETRGGFDNINPDIPAAIVPREDEVTILRDIRAALQSDRSGMQNFVFNDFLTLGTASGEQTLQFHSTFRYLLVPNVPRDVTVYVGAGRSLPLGHLRAGETLSAEIPIETDSVTLVWGTGAVNQQIQVIITAKPLDVSITGTTVQSLVDNFTPNTGEIGGALIYARDPFSDNIYRLTTYELSSDALGQFARGLNVAAANLVFNGASFDRVRGDIANGMDVDLTRFPPLPTNAVAGAVSVGVAATLVLAADGTRKRVQLINASANPIYWDTSAGVTTASGMFLPPNVVVEIPYSGTIYAISTIAASSLRYAVYKD